MTVLQQQAFEVREASQVGQLRRAVAQHTARLGFDEVAAGRAALVATELGHNLVRHAQDGWCLVGTPDAGTVELLALDHGPGMDDPQRCLDDGFSTGPTPGTGFGAVRRLSREFGVYSRPGVGTVVLSRVGPPVPVPAIAWGAAHLPAPGETVCGDGFAVQVDGHGACALLLDGLGHGPQAAAAAQAGLAVLAAPRRPPGPAALLDEVHRALQGSRGAAGSALSLDAAEGNVRFAGIGNVTGRLLSGVADRSLLGGHGTLGLQTRRAQDQVLAWPPHTLALLHSDGLASRWTLADEPGLLQQDPAVIAAWLLRRHRRGRDDASVVVLRRGAARNA
ncbi:ATP-binding protein [Aquabacterium sp. J223]|uniref:ATP-binding protein n=1 Tax=Aquabacterium sp. J223 TaxID=2898431 RepID=UPI0021AE11A0|nr:ATP-binding protein [Aquabacterium sp. J223]UUX94751.1 SpoIIE family protein phosphatase [Aquabacterium sp. J223]